MPLFWDIDFNSLARLQGNSVKTLLGCSWEAWKKDKPVLNEMIILEPLWQTAETVISMAERSGQARGDMLCLENPPSDNILWEAKLGLVERQCIPLLEDLASPSGNSGTGNGP